MFSSFRLSMTWMHTWVGLVLGYVLMVCFFFGALSVFDREIDRWAIPETRFEPQTLPSYDTMLRPIFEQMQPSRESLEEASARIGGKTPEFTPAAGFGAYTTHRDPVLELYSEYHVTNNPADPHDHVYGYATIDPRTGRQLPDDQLKIGSEFFYPLHFSLHFEWLDIGYWLVGIAALVMLAALVSGVVIHRKIFREFFTFRPNKQTQRSALDLHNLTGVVGLPFHFFFALTGLIVFAGIYFPVGHTMLEPVHELHEQREAAAKGLAFDPAGVPAPIASVDAMVEEAKRRWAARDMSGEVGYLGVTHVGDANSYVSVYRAGTDRVTLTGQGIHFNATTGAVILEEPSPSAVEGITDFMTGLHLQHFRHWMLRWLYVMGGLAGCACIATGFIFFVEKRKRQHAKAGVSGARWADAMAVTAVTGMVIAAVAILVGNRLLPAGLADRGVWEERIFWFAWLAALLHAAWRSAPVQQARIAPAWREQCWAIAVLAVAAVLLNWITTGDHLIRTIGEGYWPVAGVDLSLLVSAAIAAFAARKLRLRELTATQPAGRTVDTAAEAAHA
ncbi:MAG TPA: PepSY-associated TM helix domain-containing protein [Povalibacter sp.]|uniref:PepSY-associated TM helix domain-containing protein n=1 Tax=Povalibacter sp. TaxID=1962978 RepID=UPI002BC3E3B0|nr:PepSY-associated TM helix domain-containing protein [Povalibacter sp.]HMN43183.1 PepSY-associated TM helix domain-containing protein [Povalibacter sp.]